MRFQFTFIYIHIYLFSYRIYCLFLFCFCCSLGAVYFWQCWNFPLFITHCVFFFFFVAQLIKKNVRSCSIVEIFIESSIALDLSRSLSLCVFHVHSLFIYPSRSLIFFSLSRCRPSFWHLKSFVIQVYLLEVIEYYPYAKVASSTLCILYWGQAICLWFLPEISCSLIFLMIIWVSLQSRCLPTRTRTYNIFISLPLPIDHSL